MKKLTRILLAFVLVFSMSVSAFAFEKEASYVEIFEDSALVEESIETVIGEKLVLESKTFKDGNAIESWGWAYDPDAFRMIDNASFRTVTIDSQEYYVSEATFEALKAGTFEIEFEIIMYNNNHTWTGADVVAVEVTSPPTGPSITLGGCEFVQQGSGKQKVAMQQLAFEDITITRADGTTGTLSDYKVGGFKDGNYEGRNFSIEFENLVFNFVYQDGCPVLVDFVVK